MSLAIKNKLCLNNNGFNPSLEIIMMKKIKLVMALIIAGLIVSACGDCGPGAESRRVIGYKLASGETVECARAFTQPCGITLLRCSNGNEYRCQTNVVKISGREREESGLAATDAAGNTLSDGASKDNRGY